jgi:hypothetical protein
MDHPPGQPENSTLVRLSISRMFTYLLCLLIGPLLLRTSTTGTPKNCRRRLAHAVPVDLQENDNGKPCITKCLAFGMHGGLDEYIPNKPIVTALGISLLRRASGARK